MKKFILLLFFTVAMQSQTVTYTESFENFANPERGFFVQYTTKPTPTDPLAPLPYYQSLPSTITLPAGISLIRRIIRLDDFRNSPFQIPSTFTDLIKADFDILRNNGLKCVLRFCYSSGNSTNQSLTEPSLLVIKDHIDKLKVITAANQDVISSIEAGFIGKDGEWTNSTNFGPGTRYDLEQPVNLQFKNDRIELGKKIMELTPNRMVAFRTPYFQQIIINSLPATPLAVPYDNSIKSRIAAHNDCFLADVNDMFTNTSICRVSQRC